MGKGYNNYMCKKPFHPGSKANIKRAWMAEQKTENEKKKQDELKVQYDKEQELYNNRALLSTESKDKLELNFMYQAPPGAKRERQKEDDEPEFKFEWQRKYNAPREDYAKGNADIKDQPFGIPVRNVRCIKCHKWGHINTDKECPLFSQASTSSMPTTSMDPMELMKQMREDGFGLKENVLGHSLNPAAANQQLIPSDESDPEMEFLKSLSASDKKKLLRKLKKLSKKQEKASRCKKKKSKKSGKSKSKDKSSDRKKKKSKKSKDSSESSDESDSESSDSESDEERQKRKKHSEKKHLSSKKDKERYVSESSDSEFDESHKSKLSMKTNRGKKEISERKHGKTDVLPSSKAYDASSDDKDESKKTKYKHSKSKSSVKEKNNHSSESNSEFEAERKYKESRKRTADVLDSDQGKNVKISSSHSIHAKSRSYNKNEYYKKDRNKNDDYKKNRNKHNDDDRNKHDDDDRISDKVKTYHKERTSSESQEDKSDDYKKNRNKHDDRLSDKVKTHHKERTSSESQEDKSSHKYNLSKKDCETKHRYDVFDKKQSDRDVDHQASKSNDNYKEDAKLNEVENYKSDENVKGRSSESLNRSDNSSLCEETSSKRKIDVAYTESKSERKTEYDQKTNHKEKEKKAETKQSFNNESNKEQLSNKTIDENKTSELKRKSNDFDFVEPKSVDEEKLSVSHFKKKKYDDNSNEDKHRTDHQEKHISITKKVIETSEELHSQKKEIVENKQLHSEDDKNASASKNDDKKLKCDSPLHPDGFSHFCPQARVEANYVQADEEYEGNEHDDFRNLNREKRSPSVKQKYNS